MTSTEHAVNVSGVVVLNDDDAHSYSNAYCMRHRDENGSVVHRKESCPACQKECHPQALLEKRRPLISQQLHSLQHENNDDDDDDDDDDDVMSSLSAQMHHMQRVLLSQKDRQVQELTDKVQALQKELTDKEVQIALLQQRLLQHEKSYNKELAETEDQIASFLSSQQQEELEKATHDSLSPESPPLQNVDENPTGDVDENPTGETRVGNEEETEDDPLQLGDPTFAEDAGISLKEEPTGKAKEEDKRKAIRPSDHFTSRVLEDDELAVANVVFVCTVVRRGTAANCPQVLGQKQKRFDRNDMSADGSLIELYTVALPRLADIGDLKLQLQNVSGIPANQLKLCKLEEVPVRNDAMEGSPSKNRQKVTALRDDKEGPCLQLAKSLESSEGGNSAAAPIRIVAFENTIRPRPPLVDTIDHDNVDDNRLTDENVAARAYTPTNRRIILEQVTCYGDKSECRVFDSDPLPISKAISRTLWPLTSQEFKLGLRVDAIDHLGHWFPGSVVEIIEDDDEKSDSVSKVIVHFDNFSSKWDETYTIQSFTRGEVCPLYSHATPRMRPTEFPVYHRYLDRSTRKPFLFGHDFFIQCQSEWSTARAGAHILAQAARFLQTNTEFTSHGPVDVNEIEDDDRANSMAHPICDNAQSSISELIDLLLDSDREYVKAALGVSDDGTDLLDDTFRNPLFDPREKTELLVSKVSGLLHMLPFEVRLATIEFPCGGGKKGTIHEEIPYPFSLLQTIGNVIHAQHAIALHWREGPFDKKNNPAMYTAQSTAIGETCAGRDEEIKADIFQPGDQLFVADAAVSPNEEPAKNEKDDTTKEIIKSSDRFTPRVVEDEEPTVGLKAAASSTCGENCHRVTNQQLLDPYGGKGIYTGTVLSSIYVTLPHGSGRMVYEDDGHTYEGDWHRGHWHGWGRATFSNGDAYEGLYRDDQRHGQGKYTWRDGRKYKCAYALLCRSE